MISKRLKTIAEYLESKKILADVGCDHGYVIIEGFLNYNIEKAYAIDNKEKPLDNARINISKYDFFNKVEFLLSDGLRELESYVDVIVMAGMGGLLILDLLKQDFNKLNDARLIIQANRNNYDVRKYLTENGYYIYDEKIVYEDDKYYEIIVFEKAKQPYIYNYNELYFGPKLLGRKDSVLKDKLHNDLRILNNIPHKNEKIKAKIELVKENLW